MSYATLMVWLNVDHVAKQLVSVAAGVADKFSAKLLGLSALAIMPPFIAEGVVTVDNASEFDIAKMKAALADAGKKFEAAAGAGRKTEWRSAIDYPTQVLLSEARCADLILIEQGKSSGDNYRTVDVGAAILGAGPPVPGGACGSEIPCCRPRRGRLEGYAGGPTCRPGRVAVPPKGEARHHRANV